MQTHPQHPLSSSVMDRIKAEHTQLKNENAALRGQIEHMQAILGNFSHQLRTPLTAIIGYGELLHHHLREEEGRMQLTQLLIAADSVVKVLQDMPAQPLTSTPHPRPCNPAVLVQELQGFFTHAAQQKGLTLALDWDSSIPQGLYCDMPRLRHILMLLVQYAIKSTEQGKVMVSIAPRRLSDNEIEVEFRIRDTSLGVTAERLQQLLQPDTAPRKFGRAHSPLPTAAKAVRHLGGELRVESCCGEGTQYSFALVFPIHHEYSMIQDTPLSIPHTVTGAWRQSRILVADDDAMNRALLARMAQQLGIGHVDTAGDGEQAAHAALEHAYDLILMDCQMPRMDGFATTRLLRQRPLTADIPVIGITADVLQADTARCYAAGMDDYYHKPLSLAQMEWIFHKWLTTE